MKKVNYVIFIPQINAQVQAAETLADPTEEEVMRRVLKYTEVDGESIIVIHHNGLISRCMFDDTLSQKTSVSKNSVRKR